MPTRLTRMLCGLFAGWAAAAAAAPHPDAGATLVVYNTKAPQSIEVARDYAEKRGIPEKNLCPIECSVQEEISRAEYDHAVIRPIREWAQAHDLITYQGIRDLGAGREYIGATTNRLKYVVLCYGVPVKIAHDPNQMLPAALKGTRPEFQNNAAAVDGELALLPQPQAPITGFLPNPLYKKLPKDVRRWNLGMVLVSRLDGPTADLAKGLVTGALGGERLGLYGRAFLDARGIPNSNAGYKLGDDWIYGARQAAIGQGWEVVFDEQEGAFGDDMDATSCALYAGWYAHSICGPFAAAGFRFRPGAVAYHIHSWSAGTLRSPTVNWAGPLVAHGAAATMGCVYEPYLQMTPNVDVLFEKLFAGATWGEAAWSSQQFLSWMNTVVGDPLYRPFAISNDDRIAAFEARLDALTPLERDALAWAWRLRFRRMFLAGQQQEALRGCYEQATRLQERTLWVGLANLYLAANDLKRAAEAAKAAVATGADRETRAGTLWFAARSCAQARFWDDALEFYRALATDTPRPFALRAICDEAMRAALGANRPKDAEFFRNLVPPSPGVTNTPSAKTANGK
ncbi:MAG: TIGR03790 family protein [Verrucomicrobiae bacterium]|nr:TIGR03790 family protein [Verrucomicrobiae bacterium]